MYVIHSDIADCDIRTIGIKSIAQSFTNNRSFKAFNLRGTELKNKETNILCKSLQRNKSIKSISKRIIRIRTK